MSGLGEGSTHANRSIADPMYMNNANMGFNGGGTLTGSSTQPTIEQYENIFGPAGRDIKLDSQRHKRHQRWHLPDALKGANTYLTDRVDGLITDSTNSPFTTAILPYVYLENPDQKLKWNVYSFDEGIASRVPYEAAARVLPQTKRSFAGYTVRQGLAIAMEHNFMVSAAGRENFKNQLTQLVGSIQLTNDLDVHVALLTAPSYQKHINEKYHDTTRTTTQICREYVDLFGFMQKTPNALDILIEDAKNHLKTWGSQPPTFLLCNGNLTAQLNMLPERTNYLTNGPDGAKRLAQGPELPSYRGLSIINSRKFSMDSGTMPRDLLRRRVRVAEYYRIPWNEDNPKRTFEFYDQSRDSMFKLSWQELCDYAQLQSSLNLVKSEYWSELSKPDHIIRSNNAIPLLYMGGKWSVTLPGNNTIEVNLPSNIEKVGVPFSCPQKALNDPTLSLQWQGCDLDTSNQNCPINATYSMNDLMHYHADFLNKSAVARSMSQTFGMGIFNDTLKPGTIKLIDCRNDNYSEKIVYQQYTNWSAANATKHSFFKLWLGTHIMTSLVNNSCNFELNGATMKYVYDTTCLENSIQRGTGKVTSPHLVNTMFVYHFLRSNNVYGLQNAATLPRFARKYSLFDSTLNIAENNINLQNQNSNYFFTGFQQQPEKRFRTTMAHLEKEHSKIWWFKLFWEFASSKLKKNFDIQHVVDMNNNETINPAGNLPTFPNFDAAMLNLNVTRNEIDNLVQEFRTKCQPFSDNIVNQNFNPPNMWSNYQQHSKL